MPEGIVAQLIVAAVLLAVVLAVVLLTRKPRGDEIERADDPIVLDDQERATVGPEVVPAESPVPEVVRAPYAEAATQEVTPAPAVRPSLRERLFKSRSFLATRLAEAFGAGPDEDTWDDVEAVLIQSDIGAQTASTITEGLRKSARERRIAEPAEVKGLLAEELVSRFDLEHERGLTFAPSGVTVWLVVGVNGTGKTTTIGKLASDLTSRGRTVALAAADTFRAAADEQLGVWAERAGAELVKHQPGADPGAVAYDAFQHARAKELDVLIVDTAGRLHTKAPLMDELGKVRRVIEKEGKVQEALLVIDATAGQNGLVQAKEFAAAAGVTGIVLTKLDGTAKGGIALAIEETLGIPIKLIGVGESIEDLEPFEPKAFVDALLS